MDRPPILRASGEGRTIGLDGEVTFQVDNQRVVAKVGMFANVPIGCPHSFRNESGHPARMLITVAPAGLDDFFLEVGRPLPPNSVAAPPPTADDITRLVEVAPRYGITILPPPQ